MKTSSVIVIGAGIGGITAAIHLAKRGLRVTVLEKNSHGGGRCDRFSRDGHHFDPRPTLFVMPLLYEAEFHRMETSMHEWLDLQRVDPTYRLVFDDGSQHVFRRLRTLGIGDLEAHIKFEETYTPLSWAKRYNLAKGSTHGLSHRLTQLAYFRPANLHPRYKNLYFVGASTHPGTGIPTAMVSGRLASERIWGEHQ